MHNWYNVKYHSESQNYSDYRVNKKSILKEFSNSIKVYD